MRERNKNNIADVLNNSNMDQTQHLNKIDSAGSNLRDVPENDGEDAEDDDNGNDNDDNNDNGNNQEEGEENDGQDNQEGGGANDGED